ncbi:STIP-like protein [Phytophthora megakarya]|uniref:STIP-like protein n=1 Tax=Phytophthora megakarya TaxID=4795 RepID=A0A225X140_9STRA|nr:STIP-like protein [Phytophthora megakarya]
MASGMSNADFARMFRKEALHEADEGADSKVDGSSRDGKETSATQAAGRDEADATDADKAPRGSGLGFGSSNGSGLGFGSGVGAGLGFRPSAGSGIGIGAEKKDTAAPRAAKSKTYGWEKHTTGFGTKMLAKMGFKGRLGKKEDGVSATIEVKMRPAQMGMGYGDFVEASNLKQNRKLQKELKGDTVEEREGVVEDDTLWRKRKVVAGRRKHKRAVDLTQEAHALKKQKKSDIVLDMRGPSVRVLSDVTAVYDVDPQRMETAKPKLGDELIYNVRMVVNLAQGKIYDLSQKIDTNTENVAAMKKEAKLIKAQLNVNDVRLQHMQALVEQMKALDKLCEQALDMQSVEPILTHLRTVRNSFPLEFDAHKLQQLVPSICMPPLRGLLMGSNFLDQKAIDSVVLQFRMVQTFLTELPSNRAAKGTNESASVLPVIREKTMAAGDDLYNFILEETLWPVMVQFVNVMKSLYPDIRLALASALNQWHPSDLSVFAVLTPWRELWGEREYGKFTHRHIVRKLIRCLHREFEINPENQSLEPLTWVLAWKDHLPDRQFIALLDGEFFPKWLNVLRKWVSGSPHLIELEKWYCGWKLLFEKNKLLEHDRFVVHFHGALVLLHVATESVGIPTESRPPVPELNRSAATNYQDALAFTRDEEVKEPRVREEKTSPRSVSRTVSLKDVIENMAISHNLTFMPKGFLDGQQVYTFGKHQIIIEQGVVFMEESKGLFKAVDLEQLL